MASETSPEAREVALVGKVEMRIALTESDAKLENILRTYLTPLLLKLASDHVTVRNKVIGVCQHVNKRLHSSPDISLPVQGLLKQYSESKNNFVKQFDLIYIQQGLERLGFAEGIEILPQVLRLSIPPTEVVRVESSEGKIWSIGFQFLLRLLQRWTLPERSSKDDSELETRFALSEPQSDVLARWLGVFLLYEGKAVGPRADGVNGGGPQGGPRRTGLSTTEVDFMSTFEDTSQIRAGTGRMSEVKAAVANFLFTQLFNDKQRFVPAVILTSDSTSLAAFRIGDTMFKQCQFDLEDAEQIARLFTLYRGVKAKIQIRILALLSKSRAATQEAASVLWMIDLQLSSGTEGLEATKLRAAIFTFLNWVVRVGDDTTLRSIAPKAQEKLKEYIDSQGWPDPREVTGTGLTYADVDLRSKAYESIGILAGKIPPNIDLVKWLFTSLRCDLSGSQIHVSIEEALGHVLNVFHTTSEETRSQLKALLTWNMTAKIGQDDSEYGFKTRRNTRYAAVRYANKCLPFSDVDARYIDLLAIGSTSDGLRQEVVDEGMRGLDPHWHQTNAQMAKGPSDSTEVVFPSFPDLVRCVFPKLPSPAGLARADDFPILGPAAGFCRNVLLYQILRGDSESLSTQSDYEKNIDALVENNGKARRRIREHLRGIDPTSLLHLINASLIGMSLNIAKCGEIAVELCSLSPDGVLEHLLERGLAHCRIALSLNHMSTQNHAARVFGILASHPNMVSQDSLTAALMGSCEKWKDAVGSQANQIRGLLLTLAFTLTRSLLRHAEVSVHQQVSSYASLVVDVLCGTYDLALREAACVGLGQLCVSAAAQFQLDLRMDEVLDALIKDGRKEHEVAVAALGRLINFMVASSSSEELVAKTLDTMYALHDIRKPELHFALGEALAVAAVGWHSSSMLSENDVDVDVASKVVHQDLLVQILSRVIKDCRTTKPSLRKASAIWLLCLVQYCGSFAAVRSQLRACQGVFARLLSDRDELVQETGSRGLSLVYEMGDSVLREDLVRDLVQSFTGNSAKTAGTVDEDTQLFEAGALPTEGGSSVTTYKDIVSLASEMGDPSLVYRFMNLASSNAIWSSRAAFGRFGLGTVLADSTYLSENQKFYPKLYRYRFDPNPNVQRSMNEIWKALVKDPNQVINENFDLILEDLLKSILGKEWRVREASCAAIADLVQGRDVEKYEKHLPDIWSAAFKVLDDIKETVRLAALALCRTLTNLLIRNLEVGEGTTKRARTLLEHAMPFLLQQLESGSAKEVQQYAIMTLLEVVKKSPGKSLKPFAPTILETLVNSLSSLEHESVNYLHLNADKYGLTTEKLDHMRVSSINASPVTEAIERCLDALSSTVTTASTEDAEYLKSAMNKLEGTFKTAIGLPSRVGLSRVLVTLVVRHNVMFRPYADRFVQLVRKNLLDRNETISVAFSTALAYLMRLASDKQVLGTSQFLHQLYFDSDDSSHRLIAGEVLFTISKVSNDVLMRFATTFLPFAFLGRSDTDTAVGEKFDATWKDNVGGSLAISLYLSEIVELCVPHIKSARWAVRHACCLATASLVSSPDSVEQYTTAQAELVWPLFVEALNGKTWEGKEKVILAFPKFVSRSKAMWNDKKKAEQMKVMALREASRQNVTYRPNAIKALGEFALVREDLDLTPEAIPLLRTVMDDMVSDDAEDHMEVDTNEGSGKHTRNIIDTTMSAATTCLFQMLPSFRASAEVLVPAKALIQAVLSTDSKLTKLALYDGARQCLERVSQTKTVDDMSQREGKESRDRRVSEEAEAFTLDVVLTLIGKGPNGQEVEKARESRVKLALALAQADVSLDDKSRAAVTSSLQAWRQWEKSRPLREQIEKALVANQRPTRR